MRLASRPLWSSIIAVAWLAVSTFVAAGEFVVAPPRVVLQGFEAQAQLLVFGVSSAELVTPATADLSRAVAYESSAPEIVTVDARGRVRAVGNGTATIKVNGTGEYAGRAVEVPVQVSGVDAPVEFKSQFMPILSKAGCNAGACHASQYGKGGFKLSVFGFDPPADFEQIARNTRGRRIAGASPAESLLLRKATMAVSHGGGKRLDPTDSDYRVLSSWIAAGAGKPLPTEPAVTKLTVTPSKRIATEAFDQQLQVTATYADGSIRDVTHWAKYDSQDENLVRVGADGFSKTIGKGQGHVLVRFEGLATLVEYVVPFGPTSPGETIEESHYIDRLAFAKLRELGLPPSPVCDDATFLRRAFLDAIGTTPTVEQAAAFLDSTDPNKRAKLVDQLLGLTGDPTQDIHNNAYAAFWTLRWADLLRCSTANLAGEQGMWAMHNWLKEAFRQDMPLDQFARELLTASGSPYSNGAANYYRVSGQQGPAELAESTAQLFLGTRLACAKCHNHPYENYTQTDYYGFAAFFVGTSSKPSGEFGLFGQEVIIASGRGEIGHPKTGQILKPTPLGAAPLTGEIDDRREALANWLTSKDERLFARNIANRYMGYLMGRGLVEPVDDLRASNPATNPPLLAALADRFVEHNFNAKKLIRDIMTSKLYQLDSQPLPGNATDDRFYSHFPVRRVAAEPLLDAIDAAAGTQTKFPGLPLGLRAIELPDATYNVPFLKTFGKPERKSVCECERSSAPNLTQALSTLNGEMLAGKITDPKGRVAKLVEAKKSQDEIVVELYLAALARRPSPRELELVQKFAAENPDAKAFYEDLLWSLINTKPFLFVR